MSESRMTTVQMKLDEDIVRAVDRLAKRLHTTRSALTMDALRDALMRYDVSQLEQKHRRGYALKPETKNEFNCWGSEQAWENE